MADLSGWEEVISRSIGDAHLSLIEYLPEGGVFYDIGANVGAFTDKILSVKPNTYCVLFEPVKEFYEYMVVKYQDNSNVKIYNVALLDSERDLEMSTDRGNLGWNTISEIQSYGDKQTIHGVTLSAIAESESLKMPDVIKIDVELSEHLVIEGSKELFKKHTPKAIHMEIGITPGQRMWDKEEAMIQYLFNIGYKEYEYKNKTITYDALFVK